MFRIVAASRFTASVVLHQARTGSSSSKLPIGHTEEERQTQLQEENEVALHKNEIQASLRKEIETNRRRKLKDELELEHMYKYEIDVDAKERQALHIQLESELKDKLYAERQDNRKIDAAAKQRKERQAKMQKELEDKLKEVRRAKLQKELEDQLEEEQYTKQLKELEAQLEEVRRDQRQKELEANSLSGKWSAPTALNVLKIDATAVSKAADWATMGTLACVGVPEKRDDFDDRFRNTAADDDPALAQNIRDHAVSVVELPSEAQFIDTHAGRLFVRNRYLPYIAARVEASFNDPPEIAGRGRGERLIVVAQPGIGKSVGVGNYLVHYFAGRLIGDASAVIVVRSFTHFHIIHDGKIESLPDFDRYDVSTSQKSVLDKLQRPPYQHVKNVLLVHDVKTSKQRTNGLKPLFYKIWFETELGRLFNSVTAVQLAPPDNVNDDKKDGLSMVSKLVIPAWSYDELDSLQAHYPRTVTIGAKKEPYYTYGYELFGGVLRTREIHLANATTVAKYRTELRENSDFFDFDTFATSSVLKTNVPSDVALIVPNKTFTNFSSLDFVSDEVLIYCKPRVQCKEDTYWAKRMKMVATDRERDGVLQSLMHSKLLLWRESVAEYSDTTSPFRYTFLGSTIDHTVGICPGPFEHIVMRVSPNGSEFADMPDKCNGVLKGEAGSVLVTFSNPNTPAIDFALLTRAKKGGTWSAFLFKCTVAGSHPLPTASADVLERLFAANGPANLNAFVWVERTGGVQCGVSAPQGDKQSQATIRFMGKQASMRLSIK